MTAIDLKEARRYTQNRNYKSINNWTCIRCGLAYNKKLFYIKSNGHPSSYCKKCNTDKSSSKNRDRAAYRKSPRGTAQDMIATARRRARKSGIAFSITIPWLEKKLLHGKCEITNLPLIIGPGRNSFGPSLDQIIPGNGYTPENTQLVCWIYNSAKGFGSHADVVTLAKAVLDEL